MLRVRVKKETFYFSILVVVNIEVMVVSDSSVRVSWETPDINNITGYTVIGYTVYYSLVYKKMENQSAENEIVIYGNSVNSINIDHLKNNRKYQFQVAVIAEIGEVFVTGERSQATSLNIVTLDQTSSTVDVAATSLNIVSLDQTLSTVDVAATSLNIVTLDQTSSTVDVAATSLNIVTIDKTTSTVDVAATSLNIVTVDVAVDFGIRYFQAVPFVVGGAGIFIGFVPIVVTMLFCLRRYVFVLAVLVMFLPSLLFIAQ